MLNLAGMLLFGKNPQRRLQVCQITAVAFPGTVLYDKNYLDSENIDGPLEEQYRRGMGFIKRNLHHVQGDQNFNSLGLLEVPEEAFVELLVNALVHRDFFVSSTIRLFVFADRVEIISPGHLSDTLTPEQIRGGKVQSAQQGAGRTRLPHPALSRHGYGYSACASCLAED